MNIHPIISKSREITPYYLLERKAKTGIAIYELSKSGEITPYYLLERKAKTGIAGIALSVANVAICDFFS